MLNGSNTDEGDDNIIEYFIVSSCLRLRLLRPVAKTRNDGLKTSHIDKIQTSLCRLGFIKSVHER